MSDPRNPTNGHEARLDRIEKLSADNAEQIRANTELIRENTELIRNNSEQIRRLSAESHDYFELQKQTREEAAQERDRLNALIEFQFAFRDDFEAWKKETVRQQVLAADEFRRADDKLSERIAEVSREVRETSAELKELGRTTDRRIAEIVSAIGQLSARTPPPPPAN